MNLPYASPQKRSFAKFIDFMVVVALGLAIPLGLGSLVGFFYSLVADALPSESWRGQSIGKKVMGIKAYLQEDETLSEMTLKASVIRNAPIAVVTFFMMIPFWGWILAGLIMIPLFAIEVSLMVRAPQRQRLGDVMAETVILNFPKQMKEKIEVKDS